MSKLTLLYKLAGVQNGERRAPLGDVAEIYADSKYTMARFRDGRVVFLHAIIDEQGQALASSTGTLAVDKIMQGLQASGDSTWIMPRRGKLISTDCILGIQPPAKPGLGLTLLTDHGNISVGRRRSASIRRAWKTGFARRAAGVATGILLAALGTPRPVAAEIRYIQPDTPSAECTQLGNNLLTETDADRVACDCDPINITCVGFNRQGKVAGIGWLQPAPTEPRTPATNTNAEAPGV